MGNKCLIKRVYELRCPVPSSFGTEEHIFRVVLELFEKEEGKVVEVRRTRSEWYPADELYRLPEISGDYYGVALDAIMQFWKIRDDFLHFGYSETGK